MIRFINVRLEHLYGPGDSDSKFIIWIIKKCLLDCKKISLTSGEQRRDFIYIEDAISAYLRMVEISPELDYGFQEIGLGIGKSISLRTLVEQIHSIIGSNSLLSFGSLPYREHEIMNSRADISTLQKIGWNPRVTLQEGLEKTIASVIDVTGVSI